MLANCRVCHGEGGNSFEPNYPRLNGQDENYLFKALKDYQTGNRKNPTMEYVLQGLTDKELKEIAGYYARQDNGLTYIGH